MSSPIKSVANAHKHLASPGPSRLRHAHAFKDDDDDDDSSDAVRPTKRRGSAGKIDPLSDSDVSSLSDEPDCSADEDDDDEDEEMGEEEDGSAGEDEDEEEEDEMDEDEDDEDDEDHVVSTRRSSASGPSTPGSQKAPLKIRLRLSPETSRKAAEAKAEGGAKASKKSSSRRASGPRWKAADEKKGAKPQRGAAVAGSKKRKADDDSASDLEEEEEDLSISLPKTARQLAKERDDEEDDSLVELPMMESSKKVKLTESEIALRKSEMARRRRNQNEKKLEDDKRETINRLLKKQVSKRSTRDKGRDGEGSDEEGGVEGEGKEGASRGRGTAAGRDPKEPRVMFRTVQRIEADGAPRSYVALPALRDIPSEAGEGTAAAKKEADAEEEGETPVVEVQAPAGPDPALPYHQAWTRAFGGESEDAVKPAVAAA